jgi:NAD(P)-dependent dehydrogenase (short-subunit alcohol dehydrogenase family)
MPSHAIVVGNSDGIGLALTHRLIAGNWQVTGVSRSPGPVTAHVADVTGDAYPEILRAALPADLVVYCAGIGEPADLPAQTRTIAVNLLGAARTAEVVIPAMVAAGGGHFIGLSSLADVLVSGEAPGYAASKAGLTSYLTGLNLAYRKHGVAVTTVRFGFVDTKMAKGPGTPGKIPVERAVDVIMRCLRDRPVVVSAPRAVAAASGLAAPILRTAARRKGGKR